MCLIMSKNVKSSICHPEAIAENVMLTPRDPSLYLQGCGGKKSYVVHVLVIILIELLLIYVFQPSKNLLIKMTLNAYFSKGQNPKISKNREFHSNCTGEKKSDLCPR